MVYWKIFAVLLLIIMKMTCCTYTGTQDGSYKISRENLHDL